ncbi:MAG: hypothetical protein FK731_04680 [Asgard group archaeon]|nr:hypothetical protein [Asgard group archaeon]
MIEIRNYKEEYLEDQVRLGYEATKDWVSTGQIPLSVIKRMYESNENFTPETRHYAFKGDEMIGYVISAVDREIDGIKEASMQFPKIPSKDKEIEKMLMEKTLSVLKEKGANILRTRVELNSKIKDQMESFVKDYGFEFEYSNEYRRALIDLDKFDVENFKSDFPIEEYDHKNNPQELEEFLKEINVNDSFIKYIFGTIDRERYTTHLVIRKGGKIIAHGVVLVFPEENDLCIINHVKVKSKSMKKEFDDLFKSLLKIIKKSNASVNHLYVPYAIEGTDELYREYGLELIEIKHCKKIL